MSTQVSCFFKVLLPVVTSSSLHFGQEFKIADDRLTSIHGRSKRTPHGEGQEHFPVSFRYPPQPSPFLKENRTAVSPHHASLQEETITRLLALKLYHLYQSGSSWIGSCFRSCWFRERVANLGQTNKKGIHQALPYYAHIIGCKSKSSTDISNCGTKLVCMCLSITGGSAAGRW